MPLQNRVDPFGEIRAHPARGKLMGNRGILHHADGTIRRRHAHRNWIACALRFRDRHQTLMAPGRYTQLFFLDEATAFAAGHRPCAECRRARYRSFAEAWCAVHGRPPGTGLAPAIDRALHAARIGRGGQVTFRAERAGLPDGTFVADAGVPFLLWNGACLRWTFDGYAGAADLPGEVTVLTPKPLVALFAAGWRPETAVPAEPAAGRTVSR
jgi:hypothetical protein